jgi:ERCC4-type nuclease
MTDLVQTKLPLTSKPISSNKKVKNKSTLSLSIDNRESALINLYQQNNITIETSNLPIGDVIFGNNQFILERKTLNDLAASIKDSRYKEQKTRLLSFAQQNNISSKNIIFLIEGLIDDRVTKIGGIPKSTLYSCLVKLQLRDGFTVLQSKNVAESFILINKIAEKGNECLKDKIEQIDTEAKASQSSYCENIKLTKKANLTPKVIFAAMLMQIPGVASTTAEAICLHYESIGSLTQAIQQNGTDAINTIKVGKDQKKISKKIVNSICDMLCIN